MNIKSLALLPLLFLATSTCHAQQSEAARRAFDEMRAAYATLDAYSMRATEQISSQRGSSSAVTEYSFRQPNRFAAKTRGTKGQRISISNGRNFYFYDFSQAPAKYFVAPMPPEKMGRIGLMQYRAAGFVTPFLAGVDPHAAPWGEPAKSFVLGAPTTLNGVRVQCVIVRGSSEDNLTWTYFIGEKDHLLRRISLAVGDEFSVTETYSDIKRNPKIPIATFAFVPPAGSYFADWGEEGHWSKTLKVGAAPPEVKVLDLQGRALNLAGMKGKVVLLDFWATWCGPCVEQLPFVKAAYRKFHDQGFEIIGISFDKERADLEKFIAENGISWPQSCDEKMFKSAINENFKVRGIPFCLLIGRDGKIAAVDPRSLLLEPAVEAALAAPLSQ